MEKKFKFGDKVRILSKSTGMLWSSGLHKYPNSIGYVNGYNTDNIVIVWTSIRKDYGDFFLEKDLELIKEIKFKIGDRVKILSKSVGDMFGMDWLKIHIPKLEGSIEKIHEKGSCLNANKEHIYVINDWFFLEKDLELIREGKEKMEKTKYEIVHSLFTTEIIKAQGCVTCSKFNARLVEFIKMFGATGAIKSGDIEKFFDEFATQEDLAWLEQKGFIKKKEEVFYKVGDIFKRNNIHAEEYYMITCYHEGNGVYKAFFCQISKGTRGNRYKEPVEICDSDKITQEEFKKMCGYSTFTLVKNATVNVVV